MEASTSLHESNENFRGSGSFKLPPTSSKTTSKAQLIDLYTVTENTQQDSKTNSLPTWELREPKSRYLLTHAVFLRVHSSTCMHSVWFSSKRVIEGGAPHGVLDVFNVQWRVPVYHELDVLSLAASIFCHALDHQMIDPKTFYPQQFISYISRFVQNSSEGVFCYSPGFPFES